jgi:hypothetical protein
MNIQHNRKSSQSLDLYKLAVKQEAQSWKNLPGLGTREMPTTRTRNGGQGRPNLSRRLPLELSSSSKSEDNNEDEARAIEILDEDSSGVEGDEEDTEEEEEEEEEEEAPTKPPASRVIVETNALTDVIVSNCRCSVCNGPVKVEYHTICIATSIEVICKNETVWLHLLQSSSCNS